MCPGKPVYLRVVSKSQKSLTRLAYRVWPIECGGDFVAHAFDPVKGYVCGLCHMPARAGKTRRAAEAAASAALAAV